MFQHLEIFKKDSTGSLIWVEAANDVPSAQMRVRELMESSPGEYLIFSHKTAAFIRSDDTLELTEQARTYVRPNNGAEATDRDFATAKVLLADDNDVVRKLIREVLSSRTDIQVCGDAVDGKEAVQKASELKPDLVILDLSMPLGGLAVAKEIVATLPQSRILLLSAYDGLALTKEARAAGVRGFVRKDEASATLLKAVETLLSGQTFFPRESLS
jgi:CheY-like chemotaxis protein